MLMKIKDLEKVNEDVKTLERKVYILEKKNIGNVFCEYWGEEFEESRTLEHHEINRHTFKWVGGRAAATQLNEKKANSAKLSWVWA